MGKILCFVPDQCADFEVTLALDMLNDEKDNTILTVGYSREPVTALSGVRYTANHTLEEAAELADVDAFLMPGGPLRESNERLISLILQLHARGALLAAICFAPQYLAHAGLLDTRRYTTSCTPERAAKSGLPDPFPRENYADERVVTDSNVITAKGYAFVDFAFAVVKHLGIYAKSPTEYDRYYKDIMNR